MNTLTPTRQQIIEVIDNLPEDAFFELVDFGGYLRYKAVETKKVINISKEFFTLNCRFR